MHKQIRNILINSLLVLYGYARTEPPLIATTVAETNPMLGFFNPCWDASRGRL